MKKIVLGGVAVLVLALAGVLVFGPTLHFNAFSVGLFQSSPAKEALDNFPVPESYSRSGDIEVIGPEGTMPEIATLRFSVADENELPDIKYHYQQLCHANGYEMPDDRLQSMEPELLCVKQDERRYSVIYSPNCQASRCEIQVSVRAI